MTGKRPPGAASVLVDLARDGFDLVRDTDGAAYAVPKGGPRVARALRGGSSLRALLSRLYRDTTGTVPSQQALADALLALEGYALDAEPVPMTLRVARGERAEVWLDLGDPTGRAIRVDADGWEIAADGPLFRRTGLTGTLPIPEPGGDLEALWDLLNVTDADRPLVLAWLVAALLEDIPHPPLTFRGEQGTGKTSGTRLLVRLIDPTPVETRKPPKDAEAWISSAGASYVVAVDNVSTVPDWWSDSLCRAVTGDGDVRRALYTDGDTHVVRFRRVVLLNGIDLGATLRDDLAERLLVVDLERIAPSRRMLDRDLARAWAEQHPRILGALLDLTARVLGVVDDLDVGDLARMADFDRVLAAVDHVLGTEGRARYSGRAAEVAADTLDGDPVLSALVTAVYEPYEGSAADLLNLITPDTVGWRSPKSWPGDSAALTRHLRRRSPSLRRLGWAIDDLGRGGKEKVLRWRLTPPTSGGHSAGIEAGIDPGAGIDARQIDPELSVEAGKAGIGGQETPTSLLAHWEEEKKREGGVQMPAMPAMPAEPPVLALVDGNRCDLGSCARGCGEAVVAYGERSPGRVCATCLSAATA